MKIIHDRWGPVEGVEEVWNTCEKNMGSTLYGWAKCGATYAMANGWREVPEVVEEDVTGACEVYETTTPYTGQGRPTNFLKTPVPNSGGLGLGPNYEWRKTEMYDFRDEDWSGQIMRYVTNEIQGLQVVAYIRQFCKPAITVWRRREK